MRFYSITIKNQDTGAIKLRYSSLNANGSNNLKALRVVFDIPFYNAAKPAGSAFIRIYGIPFNQLNQASDFINNEIEIYGGMSSGLPLANPNQRGIILKGSIWQAFGNWQGTEIVLDLVVQPFNYPINTALNLNVNWKKGDSLTTAVTKALRTAYPSQSVIINGSFDPRLIATSDQNGLYYTVEQLASTVDGISRGIINDINYLGAQITKTNNGFYLYDNSTAYSPKPLLFTDFIGNATYVDYQQINFKTVLRGDLTVGDVITMPAKSNIANSRNSFTQFRDNISFQNNFRISQIRHVCDSRQTTADGWCTVIDAYILTAAK